MKYIAQKTLQTPRLLTKNAKHTHRYSKVEIMIQVFFVCITCLQKYVLQQY